MTEMTAGQAEAAGEALEMAAATLLGRMLFEFSRLDSSLGLCLVWSGEGRRIEALTAQVSGLTIHKRIEMLEDMVSNTFPPGSEKRVAYDQWMKDTQSARLRRNELTHGRWAGDPYRDQVLNIIGLPTSPEQREARYSIADLADVLENLQRLQSRLNELRRRWPV